MQILKQELELGILALLSEYNTKLSSIEETEEMIELMDETTQKIIEYSFNKASHFSEVVSRLEKRSKLFEKLYNTYLVNVDNDGMPCDSVIDLVKLHKECEAEINV